MDSEAERRSSKKFATSVDVARHAGVSQSAVSRTFTEGASVSAKTRAKVLKAAEELGYSPSMIPRIMLNKRSALIALVIGALDHPDYATVVELFTRAIQDMGSRVLLFAVDHDQYIDDVVPKILSYRVDGIISALALKSPQAADSCARASIPVVLFNSKVRNSWVASVCCDNVGGGREVASLFLKRRARRFAYVSGPRGNLSNEERMAGYVGRLMEDGIRDVAIVSGDFRFDGGFRAGEELFASKTPPDAIFCANDLMAIGVIEAARTGGLSVPHDVMVAGFDDIPASAWPSFGLTTVRQESGRMVEEALAVLREMMDADEHGGGILRVIQSPLVERMTTAR